MAVIAANTTRVVPHSLPLAAMRHCANPVGCCLFLAQRRLSPGSCAPTTDAAAPDARDSPQPIPRERPLDQDDADPPASRGGNLCRRICLPVCLAAWVGATRQRHLALGRGGPDGGSILQVDVTNTRAARETSRQGHTEQQGYARPHPPYHSL